MKDISSYLRFKKYSTQCNYKQNLNAFVSYFFKTLSLSLVLSSHTNSRFWGREALFKIKNFFLMFSCSVCLLMIQLNNHNTFSVHGWLIILINSSKCVQCCVECGVSVSIRCGLFTLGDYNLNCWNKVDLFEIEKYIGWYTKEVWCK